MDSFELAIDLNSVAVGESCGDRGLRLYLGRRNTEFRERRVQSLLLAGFETLSEVRREVDQKLCWPRFELSPNLTHFIRQRLIHIPKQRRVFVEQSAKEDQNLIYLCRRKKPLGVFEFVRVFEIKDVNR